MSTTVSNIAWAKVDLDTIPHLASAEIPGPQSVQLHQRASAIMTQIGTYLGTTLANLAVIFFPDRIALTGGTAAAGEVLRAACQRQFDALIGEYYHTITGLSGESFRQAEIVLGVGGETGILGAVVELFEALDNTGG